MRGTVNEEWPITFEKLMSTYTYKDHSDIKGDALGTVFTQCSKDAPDWIEIRPIQDDDAPIVWAEPTDPDDIFEVTTSWDEVLTVNRPGVPHGNGDWIVYEDLNDAPNKDNRWVVNGAVFETTYVLARASKATTSSHCVSNQRDGESGNEPNSPLPTRSARSSLGNPPDIASS